MDVITVLRPENDFAADGLAGRRVFADSPRESAAIRYRFAFPAPLVALVLMAASLALVPPLQQKLGFYRLGRISFGPDDTLELAFDSALGLSQAGADLSPADGTLPAADAVPLDPAAASVRPVTWQRYTVGKGDSVSRIASRFSLRNMSTVLSVNGIDNARKLRVGQVLDIPSMDGIVYTVAKGDNLSAIARRYSIGVNALLDANDLETETLAAGQRLFVPGASMSRFDLKKALGELFVRPVAGRLTSTYGYRKDPFTGAKSFHTGIDLAIPLGTPVKATLDGKVAATGYSPVYGNYVIITHDGGYQSLYGHLQSIGTRKGASVVQGAIIGKSGSTGYSTGPHVHFSVYKNGKTINPLSVLE